MPPSVESLYLRDLGSLLKERAFEAKRRANLARGTDAEAFEKGRYFAYHEVISLILSQAQAFQIGSEKISLENVDAERDLLG